MDETKSHLSPPTRATSKVNNYSDGNINDDQLIQHLVSEQLLAELQYSVNQTLSSVSESQGLRSSNSGCDLYLNSKTPKTERISGSWRGTITSISSDYSTQVAYTPPASARNGCRGCVRDETEAQLVWRHGVEMRRLYGDDLPLAGLLKELEDNHATATQGMTLEQTAKALNERLETMRIPRVEAGENPNWISWQIDWAKWLTDAVKVGIVNEKCTDECKKRMDLENFVGAL